MDNYTPLNIICLLIAAGVSIWAFISHEDSEKDFARLFDDNITYNVWLAVIFFLALFMRIYKFGSIPAGMNQDGAMAAVDAWALTNYATDRFGMFMPVHFTAWGYGQMSVLMSYMMIPFMKVMGMGVISARLPLLIVSIGGVVVLYDWVRRMYGRVPALLAGAVIAINPWQIMQSRWALDCNMFPHFLLFGLYFLYRGIEERRYFLYISMVFFALSLYTYGVAFFAVAVLLVLLCTYLLITTRIKARHALLCGLIFFVVAGPILAMIYINYKGLPSINTPFFTVPLFPNSVRSNELIFFSKDKLASLLTNIKSLTNVVFIQKADLPWNTIPLYGPLYLFAMPFIICGIAFLFSKRPHNAQVGDRNAGRFFLLAWVATGILTGLTFASVNVNRINLIFYPLTILCALGVYYIVFLSVKRKTAAIAIFSVFAISFSGFTIDYFGKFSEQLAYHFSYGYGSAISYANSQDCDYVFISSNIKGWTAPDASDILTQFYLETDAKYFQGQKDEYDKKGNKLLPYKDRYVYKNFFEIKNVVPDNSTVYVLPVTEQACFDSALYDFVRFGYFCVATPKEYPGFVDYFSNTEKPDNEKPVGENQDNEMPNSIGNFFS